MKTFAQYGPAPATQPAADAVPPATQPTTLASPDVAALVGQLDDPDFGVRELAEAKLEEMGPGIEGELRAAVKPGTSDEARARIYHLLREFEQARAMHASITMHYNNAPAMKVLSDFAAQAGAGMGIDEPSVAAAVQGKMITLSLDNAGFWEGLRAIDEATGLTPYISPNGVTLAPVPGRMTQINMSKPWVSCTSGVLVQAIRMEYALDRDLVTDQPPTGFVNVQFSVVPEPRLHVIGMMAGNWIKECVDDKGNSLVQEGGFNRRFMLPRMVAMRGPRLWQFPLIANFRKFPGIGTRIARLKGELSLSIQTQGLITEIGDITRAANTSKDDGQLSVTVLSCNRTNMMYELMLQIRGAAINDPVYQEFVNSVELLDDKGQSIPRQTYVPRPMPDGVRVTMGYMPTQSTPAKLHWERTLEQKRLTVPFEIDNLPPWSE